MANTTYSVSPQYTTGTINISTLGNGVNGTTSSLFYTATGSYNNMVSSAGATGLYVSTDATFEGDVVIKGRSIAKLLESIEDRLAILQEPKPEKLAKHAALKKAYDHYKLLEKLIGED